MKRLLLLSLFLTLPSLLFAGPFDLPPGSYQNSCIGCTMMRGQLSCFCRDRNQMVRQSTLMVKRRCLWIANFNGNLGCTKTRRRHPHWRPRRPHLRFRKKRFNAGPIWSQMDANNKCPAVCANHRGKWTGVWNTTRFGQMSVCQCRGWYR